MGRVLDYSLFYSVCPVVFALCALFARWLVFVRWRTLTALRALISPFRAIGWLSLLLDVRSDFQGHVEICQQSILRTTHFFSRTEMFWPNTRFLSRFCKQLIVRWLSSFDIFLTLFLKVLCCRLACFVLRNMADRASIHGFPSFETCQTVTRKGMFRNGAARFR